MFSNNWISRESVTPKQITKIKPYLQEIHNENSPRFLQSFQQICAFFLGTYDSNGMLFRFGLEFAKYEPLEWATDLQRFLEHINPDSALFGQLLRKKRDLNYQVSLPTNYLPDYMDSPYYDKTRLNNIRVTHAGLSLPLVDAFYMMLTYAICQSESIDPPTTQYDHLMLDEYYSSLSRNPLLVLLRKHIEYFSYKDRSILQTIVYMLRIYLVDKVLIKFEMDRYNSNGNDGPKLLNQSQNSSSMFANIPNKKSYPLKYSLKNHHMHALYLALRYAPEYIAGDFYKYSQAIVEYFPILNPDPFCLQTFIRLWIYSLSYLKETNIENKVIDALKNANSKDGWFYLKRYSPQNTESSDSPNNYFVQMVINIFKLFEKQSYWVANPSYLFTFACLFKFLSYNQTYYHQFSNSAFPQQRRNLNESRENSLLQKIFKLIVVRFNQNMVDTLSKIKKRCPNQYNSCLSIIKKYQEIILTYLTDYFKSRGQSLNGSKNLMHENLPNDYKFKQIKQSDLKALEQSASNIITMDALDRMTSENKRNLVSFYRAQPKGCWQIPIQYNQSTALYWVFFVIAKIVDFVIPGKREQPILNIRFMANPLILLLIITVFVVISLFL